MYSSFRKPILLIYSVAAISITIVSGCRSTTPGPPTGTPSVVYLTPYFSPTLTQTPQANLSTTTVTPTVPASPTPTPLTYTVVKGDTMLAIALRFGIRLEDLLEANPAVDPRALSIGKVLTIPLSTEGTPSVHTETPLPIRVGEPSCFHTGDDGAWCFLDVENTLSQSLENLSAQIYLTSADGKEIAQGMAIPPLNVIPSGRSLPLMVFFGPPVPDRFIPRAEITSAFLLHEDNDRYIETGIEVESEGKAIDGSSVRIEGRIILNDTNKPARQIWLVAIAYDDQANPVGVRRWEANRSDLLESNLIFDITVYSLGPPIQHVELLAEARP